MMAASGKSKVGVGVIVGVGVMVGVGVIVVVGVIVGVDVLIGVGMGLFVGVGVSSEGVGLRAVVWPSVGTSATMVGVGDVQPTTTKENNTTRKDKPRLIFVSACIL